MSEQENTVWIRFLGAAGTVTGSCTLLEYRPVSEEGVQGKTHYYLVDCGMYQGEDADSWQKRQNILKRYAGRIERIFITHSHLDHIGTLPDLIEWGFKGKVECTKATQELMKVMLADAIKIQYPDKKDYADSIITKINFDPIDDESIHNKFNGFGKTSFPVAQNLFVTPLRTSHILGSVSWTFYWTKKYYQDESLHREELLSLHFSGDIGSVTDKAVSNILFKSHKIPYYNFNSPKYIIMESTYGDRIREKTSADQRVERLSALIEQALEKGNTVIIPAFALDRAQQILVDLYQVRDIISKQTAYKRYALSKANKPLSYFWEKNDSNSTGNKEIMESVKKQIEELWGQYKSGEDFNPQCLYNDLPLEMRDKILELENESEYFKNEIDGWAKRKSSLKISSPLTEKINEIYGKHLADDVYVKSKGKEDGRLKYKYLSEEFIKRFFADSNEEYSLENHKKMKGEIEELLRKILRLGMPQPNTQNGKKKTVHASNAIQEKIIISASGMCSEGAVVDLLKEYLPKENATVILTGYQAENTNGWHLRKLAAGEYNEEIKYRTKLKFGETEIRLADIKCEIIDEMIPYYSGHADQEQLCDYILGTNFPNNAPTTVFLNHGTNEARAKLKEAIDGKNKENISVKLPSFDTRINLNTQEEEPDNEIINETDAAPLSSSLAFKYFCINGVHIYFPTNYDNQKIEETISLLVKLNG